MSELDDRRSTGGWQGTVDTSFGEAPFMYPHFEDNKISYDQSAFATSRPTAPVYSRLGLTELKFWGYTKVPLERVWCRHLHPLRE